MSESWCLLSSTTVPTLLPTLLSFSTRGRIGLDFNVSSIQPSHTFSLLLSSSPSRGRMPGLAKGDNCEVCATGEGCACGEDGRWGLMDLGWVHLSSWGAERDRERSMCPSESRKEARTVTLSVSQSYYSSHTTHVWVWNVPVRWKEEWSLTGSFEKKNQGNCDITCPK